MLEALATAAQTKAPKFVPQNVSNILHGYAKLEHHPGHLMDVMASELIRNVDKFTPQVGQLSSTQLITCLVPCLRACSDNGSAALVKQLQGEAALDEGQGESAKLGLRKVQNSLKCSVV